MLLGLEKKAGALSYFFTEGMEELLEPSRASAIERYFSEREPAAGSVARGVGRTGVAGILRSISNEQKVEGESIYRRILLYDTGGDVVADTLISPFPSPPMPDPTSSLPSRAPW